MSFSENQTVVKRLIQSNPDSRGRGGTPAHLRETAPTSSPVFANGNLPGLLTKRSANTVAEIRHQMCAMQWWSKLCRFLLFVPPQRGDWGLRFACRTQRSSGRETIQKHVWKEQGYFVQNFTRSSTSIIHCPAFAAISLQSYQGLIRENCSTLLAQCIVGRPTGRFPNCCQCSIRRTHRSWGKLMM